MLALCANGLLREVQADELESATRDLEPSWLVRLANADDGDRIRNALTVAGAA